MMLIHNGEYPRYLGDVYLEVPDWDGVDLPEGWSEVVPTDAPEILESEALIELAPVLIDGVFAQTWSKKKLTASQKTKLSNMLSDEAIPEYARVVAE